MTLPSECVEWLQEHGKSDLFECNWQEIKDCLAASGRTCPIADYALGKEIG